MALAIDDAEDGGESLVVTARTRDANASCPWCGPPSGQLHVGHERLVADFPIRGRPVRVGVRVRRLCCDALGCERRSFREQTPGLLEWHQPRTSRLTAQVCGMARELAGRAGVRVLGAVGVGLRGTSRCGRCARSRYHHWPCRGRWGSTTSRCDAAASTRPSWSTRSPAPRRRPSRPRHQGRGRLAAPASGRAGRPSRRLDRLRPGGTGRAARRLAGRRPVAPVGRHGRLAETTRQRWGQARERSSPASDL